MSRIRKWNNAPGRIFFEFDHENGVPFVCDNCPAGKSPEEWGEILLPVLGNPPPGMLEINFLSTGYYDPGVRSGPPEKCYPPEGEDERVFNGAVYYFAMGKGYAKPSPFCDKVGQRVFDALEETAIADAELDGDD